MHGECVADLFVIVKAKSAMQRTRHGTCTEPCANRVKTKNAFGLQIIAMDHRERRFSGVSPSVAVLGIIGPTARLDTRGCGEPPRDIRGYFPTVSLRKHTDSDCSKLAFATSVTSARVGIGFSIIDATWCVAR